MEVVLFSTGCPKCKVLERKLEDKGIVYTENNNTDDMKERGFTSVPILSVNGQLLNFYDANKWINEARTR